MQQHQIDNLNARVCWETVGLRDGKTIVVLIVHTDLILDQENADFDAEPYEGLLGSVKHYLLTQTHIDSAAFYKMGDH